MSEVLDDEVKDTRTYEEIVEGVQSSVETLDDAFVDSPCGLAVLYRLAENAFFELKDLPCRHRADLKGKELALAAYAEAARLIDAELDVLQGLVKGLRRLNRPGAHTLRFEEGEAIGTANQNWRRMGFELAKHISAHCVAINGGKYPQKLVGIV